MKIIRQIFCKHIYRDIDREELRHTIDITYHSFIVWAVTVECVKCGKKDIQERETMIQNVKEKEDAEE